MPVAQKWLVCEQSGRWAAALRSTFARSAKSLPAVRLYEVRTIVDLRAQLDELIPEIVPVEVGRENLTDVLELLVLRESRPTRYVALLQDSQLADESTGEPIAELLFEMGVVEVVESPRQLTGLLELKERLAATSGREPTNAAEFQSFADWAWSTLPWQDA